MNQSDPLCPPPPRESAFDRDQGLWILSRYEDVKAALREPGLWPVAARKTKNLKIPDEAAQQALRTQVMDAFAPPRLSEWQVRIDAVAEKIGVAEDIPSKGPPFDLVAGFIEPWCMAVAGIVTGAPVSDHAVLLAAARIVSRAAEEPMDEDLRQQATRADAELARYFENSVIPMAGPTFVALSRTVACLIAAGWLALLRHPAELAQLRGDQELIPKAIEEILRYACLPQFVLRHASRPVAICGVNIAEGDRLMLRLASANRDPVVFPEPDCFRIQRRGSAHLSLGHGMHACSGGALIRLALTAALAALVTRFGCMTLRELPEWTGGSGFRSPVALIVS